MLIKNSLIINPKFVEAFTDLMTFSMPAKQCLELASCVEDVLGQHQILSRARKAIVDKYCKKDSEGKPVVDTLGNLVFDTDDIKKQCKDELNEIFDEEVDIALSNKVVVHSNQPMTPQQVKLLKDVIEIVDHM